MKRALLHALNKSCRNLKKGINQTQKQQVPVDNGPRNGGVQAMRFLFVAPIVEREEVIHRPSAMPDRIGPAHRGSDIFLGVAGGGPL